VLKWQQYNGCHFVSFVTYISGATFEEHRTGISGDILDSVLCCLGGAAYDIMAFLIYIVQKYP